MLALLSAILREAPFRWPSVDAAAANDLFDLARMHGVHLLIADRLWHQRAWNDCPPAFRDRLSAALRSQAAVEELARRELRVVHDALTKSGIRGLLFKGTALAYTHYHDSTLRPRIDTDVLVDHDAIRQAGATLERIGYRRPAFTSGQLVTYQVPYCKSDRHGMRHAIDLHWRISNPQVFAHVLAIDELRANARPIPPLGSAEAVGATHALMLACIHRVAHHSDEERLIWLYDIHLVAGQLTAAERDEFIEMAKSKKMAAVCEDGLRAAHRHLSGEATAWLADQLARPLTGHERSKVYVGGAMRKVDVLLSDLRALDGWHKRMTLLREHVIPPASYIRQKYGVTSRALVPFYYFWRIATGAAAWWGPAGQRRRRK